MHVSKKILLINNSAHISGAEHSLIDLLHVLTRIHNVTVVIPEKGELYERLINLSSVNVVFMERIRLKRNPVNLLKQAAKVFKAARLIAKIVKQQQIDVIYCNTAQAHIYGMLVKLLTSKPIIWHVRDNISSKLLAWFLSINTDRIVAISRHICRQLPSDRRIQLVYNGIDTVLWEKRNENARRGLREELAINNDKITIAHIGQFVPWKRHELFIELAANISNDYPNVHFILIGQDHFNDHVNYVKQLHEKIQHAGLATCFSIIPYGSSLQPYLADVNILTHLAHREPFGRVVMEAMAVNIPVVTFSGGGPEEIVVDGLTGFLLPDNDLMQLIEKVKLLIDDPELRTAFGRNSRNHIVKTFPIGNLSKILDIIAGINV